MPIPKSAQKVLITDFSDMPPLEDEFLLSMAQSTRTLATDAAREPEIEYKVINNRPIKPEDKVLQHGSSDVAFPILEVPAIPLPNSLVYSSGLGRGAKLLNTLKIMSLSDSDTDGDKSGNVKRNYTRPLTGRSQASSNTDSDTSSSHFTQKVTVDTGSVTNVSNGAIPANQCGVPVKVPFGRAAFMRNSLHTSPKPAKPLIQELPESTQPLNTVAELRIGLHDGLMVNNGQFSDAEAATDAYAVQQQSDHRQGHSTLASYTGENCNKLVNALHDSCIKQDKHKSHVRLSDADDVAQMSCR